MTIFIPAQKQKYLSMKVTLLVNLYYNYNKHTKTFMKSSGWIIDSVVSIPKYNRLARSNFIKLPKELDHPIKGLINIQNIDDNECFK